MLWNALNQDNRMGINELLVNIDWTECESPNLIDRSYMEQNL